MVVSSTSMKLPSATTSAISQGFANPLPAVAGVSASIAWVPSQTLSQRRRDVDPHRRNDGHARAERDISRRIIHDDLDRHALDDLDVVAGGVLGGQQRERGAGARLNAVDMAADHAPRIAVDLERCRLSRPHAVELNSPTTSARNRRAFISLPIGID